jgi:hypothetical protein
VRPTAKEHHFGTAKKIVLVIFVENLMGVAVLLMSHPVAPRDARFLDFCEEISRLGASSRGSMPERPAGAAVRE